MGRASSALAPWRRRAAVWPCWVPVLPAVPPQAHSTHARRRTHGSHTSRLLVLCRTPLDECMLSSRNTLLLAKADCPKHACKSQPMLAVQAAHRS